MTSPKRVLHSPALRLRHFLAALCTGGTAFAGVVSYDFNDNALPFGSELRGTAAIANGEVVVTNNSSSQAGSFVLPDLDAGQYVTNFSSSFDLFIGNAGNPPADGLSFSFGQLPGGVFTEGGIDSDGNNFTLTSGLTISFDTYGGNDGTAGAGIGIEITYGQRRLYAIAAANLPGATLDTNSYVPVSVNWNINTGLDVSYNGQTLVTGMKLVRSQSGNGAFPTGSRFGFGARTGLFTEQHSVDNIQIGTDTQATAPTLNGRISGTVATGTIVSAYNTSGTPNTPGNEGVTGAFDDSITTKYLNFNKSGAGAVVVPALPSGQTGFLLDGFVLTAANDDVRRDPTSYTLEGSNDGSVWSSISTGSIPAFGDRYWSQEVDFQLTSQAFTQFRIAFPTLVDSVNGNSMQIGEIELLGQAVPEPSTVALAMLAAGALPFLRRRRGAF